MEQTRQAAFAPIRLPNLFFPGSNVRRFVRIVCLVLTVLAVAAGLLSGWVYYAWRQVPEFYEQALQLPPEKMAEAGDQLEEQVLALHNEVQDEGRWEAVFTAEQINGWLGVDLREKFPNLLPPQFQQPRVAIDQGQAQVACRYEGSRTPSVLSLAIQAYLTEQPNVVAIRIRKARAGMLPIPRSQVLDRVSELARQADVPLQWAQQDGDPVALVTVPGNYGELDHSLRLDTLELHPGELHVAGRTTPRTESQDDGQGS